MKKTMKILSLAALVVVSLGVVLYPLIANYLSEKNRSLIETQYTKTIEQMDTSALDAARAEAVEYNKTLVTIPEKPYTKDALIKAAESYDTLLNVREDGLMGYVEIPAVGVNLPIYHGTEESTLDRGVGHLLGSSLPVGGVGTHCVLTGHSGLAGQKMFSDLNLLKEGDLFFLRVLGQTLAYKVVEIYTVLPEDTGKLTIDDGRDLCTLVTCTPYGVNSHRLLLRGERTEYEEAVSVIEDAEFTPVEESTWGDEYRHGLIYGGLTVAGIGAGCGIYKAAKKQKRRRRSMRQEKARGRHETH
jgi:sortase A